MLPSNGRCIGQQHANQTVLIHFGLRALGQLLQASIQFADASAS